MRTRHVAAAAAAMALSTLALTACGSNGSGQGSGPVTITYATVATGNLLKEGEAAVIADFEKANPNIKVNIESVPIANYSTKLVTEFRGGQGPDLGRVNGSDLRTYAAAGFLTPLSSVTQSQKINVGGMIPGAVSAAQVNGIQYTLPLTTDTRVLYYNPSLLKSRGIANPPATWAELLADTKKFAGTGAYGYGYLDSGNDYAMSSETVGPYLIEAGGKIVNAARTKAIAESSVGTIQAVQFVQSLVKTGATPKGGSLTEQTLAQLFSQNKLAFMLGGPWVRTDIQKDNPNLKYGSDIATTTVPVEHQGGRTGSTSGGWYVGVFKHSKNAAAAAKLLGFIMQKENLVKLNVPEGFPPLVDGLNSAPWSTDPFYKAFSAELVGSGHPIPPLAANHEIAVDFSNAVTPVLTNPYSSATAALKQFDATVNSGPLQ